MEIAVACVSAKPERAAPRSRPRLPKVRFRKAQRKRIPLIVAAKEMASLTSNARPGVGSWVIGDLEAQINRITAYATAAIPERNSGFANARHVPTLVTSRTIAICNTVATLASTAAEVAALAKAGSRLARWPMAPIMAVAEIKPLTKPARARPNREPKARRAM